MTCSNCAALAARVGALEAPLRGIVSHYRLGYSPHLFFSVIAGFIDVAETTLASPPAASTPAPYQAAPVCSCDVATATGGACEVHDRPASPAPTPAPQTAEQGTREDGR